MNTPLLQPIYMNDELTSEIYSVLSAAGEHRIADLLKTKGARSERELSYIDRLPNLDENEFDVDDVPVVAVCDGGAYVMVWRWIHE